MIDPVSYALKIQQVAAIGFFRATEFVAATLVHTLKGEAALFGMPFHRRGEELHYWHPILAVGPRWDDHYGKRAHDVDVEHMR
jgi:hypothetical protein